MPDMLFFFLFFSTNCRHSITAWFVSKPRMAQRSQNPDWLTQTILLIKDSKMVQLSCHFGFRSLGTSKIGSGFWASTVCICSSLLRSSDDPSMMPPKCGSAQSPFHFQKSHFLFVKTQIDLKNFFSQNVHMRQMSKIQSKEFGFQTLHKNL